jgi:hypothetical protein
MGYIVHDAVVVTVSGGIDPPPDVEAFRQSLPDKWRRLVIGPVEGVVNGDHSYAFLPDGSKEGWPDSDDGDQYRKQFIRLFDFAYEDGSTPYDVAEIRFGGDEREWPRIRRPEQQREVVPDGV